MSTEISFADGIPVHCAHHAIMALDELKPHPLNPKKHPESQLAVYAEAIRLHGWREPVTISRRSGHIISGHGAIEAARRLGVTLAPVEYQEYESDAAELADLLAQNRISELGKNDKDLLKSALLQVAGSAGTLCTGYTDEFLANLTEAATPLPQYPITARLNERHDYLVVTVDSETDWQFLKNIAGVRTERSYKNKTIGEGRVIPFARFLEALRENLHSIASTCPVDDHAQAAQ